MLTAHSPTLALQHTLVIPAHVSTLTYTHNGMLILGSDDGSLRLYQPPGIKVTKAVRGLEHEVSSVIAIMPSISGFGHIWVACGSSVRHFRLKMGVKTHSDPWDALSIIQVGENDEDVVNEARAAAHLPHENRKTLAFTTDSGTVGVVDLMTKIVQRMKTQHSSICATANFVPDRPSEIISGGYDSALLHFDFRQGMLLSRRVLTSLLQSSTVSFSPPFILCLSVSSTGAIAAGTADGQLWVGLGGDKRNSVKRTRKWGGLREDMSLSKRIADGPVVALAFLNPTTVITSTLLGNISQHSIRIEGEAGDWRVDSVSLTKTQSIEKVNALAVHGKNITLGGLKADGKGAAEVYEYDKAV
ncbi:WD40-repeat-containing domain protein [Multifurca ochricompacta]|uniref:WD40-repeat-containing domain protein n=1 Tax=Multifurca ochricompacta TaxID=376703 RepID=A0AAD4MAL9_9AGAM|nr:WD40-repeat-containing domain protein [Multifurca ochricompacta]